jgi:pyruvate dehydrogenase (quinone)
VRRFPDADFLPTEGTARSVQFDIVPDMLSLRDPMEVHLVGDGAQTLRALLPLRDRRTERSWRGHIEDNVASATPIDPQRVPPELSSRRPERAARGHGT